MLLFYFRQTAPLYFLAGISSMNTRSSDLDVAMGIGPCQWITVTLGITG